MALQDVYNLSTAVVFKQRVMAAIVHAAIIIYNEVANEVQSIITTGNPTGGTFTLTFNGQTTASIPFNATAGQIQAVLQALSNVGAGNVICTSGPLPGAVSVTFSGTLGGSPQNIMTHTDALTGGSAPAVAISRTTAGIAVVNRLNRLALAQKILANPLGYTDLMSIGVADSATVQADWPGPAYAPTGATVDSDISNQVSAIFNAYT